MATINYFAIYEMCVEILADINKSEHLEGSRDPYEICACLTQRLLQGADAYIDDLHIVKTLPHRTLLENCKRGILKVAGAVPLSDYQWQL